MTLAVNIAQGGSNNVTFRNRIINGAMVIDQRNAGNVITAGTGGTSNFAVDRFIYIQGTGNAPTLQRSTTAPAGFLNSLLVTSGTGATASYAQLGQRIEGLNMTDVGYGTVNAQTLTLSFWVRSSITGTFSVSLRNSGTTRSYIATYTIGSANTWTYITTTIPGDTSGTWLTDTSVWGYLVWDLIGGGSGTAGAWTSSSNSSTAGSTGIINTTNATFYLTGVQLEAGTTASPFEYRQYGTELALCQRYYENSYPTGVAVGTGGYYANGFGIAIGTGDLWGSTSFKVLKRATPTIAIYGSATGTANKARQSVTGTEVTSSGVSQITAVAFTDVISASLFNTSVPNNVYDYMWTATAEL